MLVMTIINKNWVKAKKQANKQIHGLLFLFDNRDFFLRFGLSSTPIRWKWVTRNASFQKRSPVWGCLTVLLYSYGRIKQRFFKTITSRGWIPVNGHAPSRSEIKDGTGLSCMLVWTDKTKSKTQRVDADFLENGEKKNIQVQTKPDTCGRGLRALV